VLGCTHYPFAAAAIQKLLGAKTVLLDGGAGTARETKRRLVQADLLLEGEGSLQVENSSADPKIIKRCMELLK
jgi:glutamate racemase